MEKEKQTQRELKAVEMQRRIDLEQSRVVNNQVDNDTAYMRIYFEMYKMIHLYICIYI
jgi:hypothetical protein